MARILIHDDDCGAPLDEQGWCHECEFYPDMRSLAFVEGCPKCEQSMPFCVTKSAQLENHHHCTRCNAWQWGSGSGFNDDLCYYCSIGRR